MKRQHEGDDEEQKRKVIRFDEEYNWQCEICKKKYKNKKTWSQHMRSHLIKYTCDNCKFSFKRNSYLLEHKRKRRCSKSATFSATQNNSDQRFPCNHCQCIFLDYDSLFQHVTINHPLPQHGGRMSPASSVLNDEGESIQNLQKNDNDVIEKETKIENQNDTSALGTSVKNRYIRPTGHERYDLLTFFGNIKDEIIKFLLERVQQLKGIKWNLCVQVEMQRDEDEENVSSSSPYFRSLTYKLLSAEDFNEHDINSALQKIFASLEEFLREGSNWFISKILSCEIHTVVYRPIAGSAFTPLPNTLVHSRSLLNINNQDDKCFLYCLLASLHPVSIAPERVENYYGYENEIKMSGIKYPVTIQQINKVEKLNEHFD